jgi:hypothetical protein
MRAVRASFVGLIVAAISFAFACDRSPTAPPTPFPLAAKSTTKPSGLLSCGQSYDSVTQVIGPNGGSFAVGPHYLYIDSLALSTAVSITAVAPAGTVRWVRFRPDGLVFQPTVDGWSALLYTNYTDCGVPTSDTLRVAQVTDSLSILGYVQTYVKARKKPWSQGTQYVVGLLQHFSNYAVAW